MSAFVIPIHRDVNGYVVMIDQTKLPLVEEHVVCRTSQAVAQAITDMIIRGAPAIGIAAAMGIALGMRTAFERGLDLDLEFERISKQMANTRPTAVNLFWAIQRMKRSYNLHKSAGAASVCDELDREAATIASDDIDVNRRIGAHGASLLGDGFGVLTHCNAGSLATGGYGTALGVIRAAAAGGANLTIFADETRPYLQGARLTTWELMKDGFDVNLITDSMAGHFMQRGEIDAVIVGTDRTVANGDVANKIGTYTLAVLAKEHDIPFYVACPISTIDLTIKSGVDIPIEERDANEVRTCFGKPIAPPDVSVRNPAFDVTPAKYVTAIITENGIARPPYHESLRRLVQLQRE